MTRRDFIRIDKLKIIEIVWYKYYPRNSLLKVFVQGVVIAQNTMKIRSGGNCTSDESNSFLVHLVFPNLLGPDIIIENGCRKVIFVKSFAGIDGSVSSTLP